MNLRATLKLFFLIITFIISSIFFIIDMDTIVVHLFLIPIAIQIIITKNFRKKGPKSKVFYIIFGIITFIDVGILLIPIIISLNNLIQYNYIEWNFNICYLIILWITLMLSCYDIKKETNSLNDILTIIVSLVVCLIHYRYYVDPKFLHNLIDLSTSYVLQNSYGYVRQYYNLFIVMYVVLLINKWINNLLV